MFIRLGTVLSFIQLLVLIAVIASEESFETKISTMITPGSSSTSK